MKNVINYYYQMNIENIHLIDGVYYFTYRNENYQLESTEKDIQTIQNLYILNEKIKRTNPYYYEIILTKDGFPYLILDQKIYCLMKKSNVINDRMSFYDIRMEPINYEVRLQPLIRFPWNRTWIKRIDYMENILNHLESKLEKLFPTFYYFLGLGENAIQYVSYTLEELKPSYQDKMVISHHRIDAKENVSSLYKSLSLVLDHPSRDISEYLKSLFFENEYDFLEIEEFINSLNFSQYGYSLLFGRLLYPSFFFDLWEMIYIDKKDEKELYKLADRKEEYRIFLKEIYYMIRRKSQIEEVRWITRNE